MIDRASWKNFTVQLGENFCNLQASKDIKHKHLFKTNWTNRAAGRELWNLFLSHIPQENHQFHHCSSCRGFFRRYAGSVWIDNKGRARSVFNLDKMDDKNPELYYNRAIRAVVEHVEKKAIIIGTLQPEVVHVNMDEGGIVYSLGDYTTLSQEKTYQAYNYSQPQHDNIRHHFHLKLFSPEIFSDGIGTNKMTPHQVLMHDLELVERLKEILKLYSQKDIEFSIALLKSDKMLRKFRALDVLTKLSQLFSDLTNVDGDTLEELETCKQNLLHAWAPKFTKFQLYSPAISFMQEVHEGGSLEYLQGYWNNTLSKGEPVMRYY